MTWTYEQSTGKLYKDGVVIGVGYSGGGDGKNNPALQNVMDVGPIPTGQYKIIGPPLNSDKHGPFVLRLLPDDDTKVFILSLGRDPLSFLMHGDRIGAPGTASEGCIIQARDVRDAVWAANPVDPDLTVVASVVMPDVTGEIAT